MFRDASTEYNSDFAPSLYGCHSAITGYITCIDQTLGTIRNAPNFTWQGGLRKQRVIQTRITHRFDVVPRAVKAASGNVSQLINLRVVKHRKRDIPLTICCLNARSVKNKALSVADFFISRDIDLSETWLGTDTDNQVINELVSSGYTIQHISRPSEKRGGGVAVLHKCGLTIKTLDSTRNGMLTHFEHMDCAVISNDVNVRLCIVYRPPPSKWNGFKNSVFFDEWSLYLDRLAVITNDVIITGDLNFHLDNANDADAVRFNGTLEAHGLVQHVVGPTHKKGHTLDVVITRDISSLLIGMPTAMSCRHKG